MYKKFIAMFGIFLVSQAPAVAQVRASQIVLAQGRLAPTLTILRTASTPFRAASFLLSEDSGKVPVHFARLFAGVYETNDSLERLSPVEEVKTLVFTESSLPLVQLWSGRLQLSAFQTTFHNQNVQLGALGYSGMVDARGARQGYSGGPRSVELSGFSLSFRFGGNVRTGHPTQAWRCVSRIVGSVLN